MIFPFEFATIPKIIFGEGKLSDLYEIIPNFGDNILIITGGSSLKKSGTWDSIVAKMEEINTNLSHLSVSGEPSPQIIDDAAEKYRSHKLDLIVGIGGGSVMDAGKAISAMIPKQDSIKNYLEGVGTKKPDGEKIPYIAIPTTSGTGSEATKNAVISEVGKKGFKKSLRHDNYIPNIAIIDPELTLSCPSSITAASGMDAFSQLLEAYISTKANPMTDALAYSGLKHIIKNIVPACTTGKKNIEVRKGMAYGALMSGISLANAGLGIEHGLASAIGAHFEIPHGVVCGTLIAEGTKLNIKKLKEKDSEGNMSLLKLANIGALIAEKDCIKEGEMVKYLDLLVETLEKWTEKLEIYRLGKYGISEGDLDKIVQKAGLKNNPVPLSDEEIKQMLKNRL
ncbi:MAG: iron-containing alcohol dehydrogenase [Promethearchaeota archaeon]|nr:MAG: iron-containing alcohol dehydrogenase [Candidatus Lokiarchaeota archaeon]